MLLVKCQIRPSSIHGLGVFAAEFIPAGTVVWRYTPPVDYRVLLAQARDEFSMKYGYHPAGADYVEFAGDAAMFVNHSSNANRTRTQDGEMIAVRDINVGEELTANYAEFDTEKPPA
jgi:SET domain-containing protein